MFQTARATRVLLLRCRPATVSTYPGSNRCLDEKTLSKAKEVFAIPQFPHKQVLHNWRFFLKAGKAATGPPVGQEFSKIGLKAMDFAKSFNDRTKPVFKDDVELIVRIQVYFDKSYTYRIEPPPTAWFILRAIRKKRGETIPVSLSGSYTALLTLEMCYEIAKMKGIRNFDRVEADQPIEVRVRRVVGQARRMGVAIIGVDTTGDSPIGKQVGEWGSYEEIEGENKKVEKSATSPVGAHQREKGQNVSSKGGKPSSASSSSMVCAAPSRKMVEKKCAHFREMQMAQYLAKQQQLLDEAPLYERMQYMHHYYPPSPFVSSTTRSGGSTNSSNNHYTASSTQQEVDGNTRLVPAFHPNEVPNAKKKHHEASNVFSSSLSTPREDPTVDGRFSTRILSPLSTEKLEEGLQDARLFTSLWRMTQPRTVFEKDVAERQAAQRYLQTRGWFKDMSREEMKVVFGDVLHHRRAREGKVGGRKMNEEGNGIVGVSSGRERGEAAAVVGQESSTSPFPFMNPFKKD